PETYANAPHQGEGASTRVTAPRDRQDTARRARYLGVPMRASPWVLAVLVVLAPVACRRSENAAAPPPKVAVARPVSREIVEWDEYTGRLQALESVEVRARVGGYLQSIHFPARAL